MVSACSVVGPTGPLCVETDGPFTGATGPWPVANQCGLYRKEQEHSGPGKELCTSLLGWEQGTLREAKERSGEALAWQAGDPPRRGSRETPSTSARPTSTGNSTVALGAYVLSAAASASPLPALPALRRLRGLPSGVMRRVLVLILALWVGCCSGGALAKPGQSLRERAAPPTCAGLPTLQPLPSLPGCPDGE